MRTRGSKVGQAALVWALALGAVPQAASAQDAASSEAAVDNTGDAPAGSALSDGSDIVVTATRRAETISKVPLSIAAFTQENLDARGVRDLRDVINQTPGVDITRVPGAGSAGQNRIVIRGIDSNAGAATSAIYVDDTPIQARNSSLNYNGSTIPFIFDLDRVEVLRGPQGTLFGASAQGGAIRFITPTPSLTEYSSYARASVNVVDGGDAGYEIGAAAGGPIIEDVLAIRFSAYRREDGGWIDRQSWLDPSDRETNVNKTKTFVGRATLLFQPTEWLSISPSYYRQELTFSDNAPLWLNCPATTGSPLNPTLNPCPNGRADPGNGRYYSYSPVKQPSVDNFDLPAVRVVGTFGSVSLTSVTSWFRRDVEDINDATQNNARVYFGNNYLFPIVPGVPRTIGIQNPNARQRNFTQEFRVAAGDTDDPIRLTAGLYYSRSRISSVVPITLPQRAALYRFRFGVADPAARFMVGDAIYFGEEDTIEKEYSAFANVDVKLVDRLTLTLGGRYSKNKLDFDVLERGVSITNGSARVTGRQESKPFLPKASLAFQATPNALYYATYSEGYRTGGVNKTLPNTCATESAALGLSPATFDPDKTKSYEIGTKNRIGGGALQYELSAFYIKWNNIQQQLRLNCAFSLITNTGSATSKGFDANVTLRPSRNFTVGIAAGYVKATYDDTVQIGTAPVLVGGQTLGSAPWTVNVNGEYHFEAGDHDPYVRAQFNFRASPRGLYLYQIPTSTTYDPFRRYPEDNETLDVRAGMNFGNVNVALYAENVLNYGGVLTEQPAFAQSTLVKGAATKPRTIGLQLFARY